MFFNILKISTSNVLKTFRLNIIVSIGCALVFHSGAQTNRKCKYALLVCRYPGRQERNKITSRNVYNTRDDVVLTNSRQEKKIFP